MPHPFDATLKDIVQKHPHDFEAVLGLTGPQPTAVLNVDLSTITAATDIVLGHGDPLEALTDLNFQASRAGDLSRRVLLYNALLHYRFAVPVHSVVVLLRPVAADPNLTGKLKYVGRRRRDKVEFSFEVVELWKVPVRRLLEGGLGVLPLAPLCRLPEGASPQEALQGVIRRIDERLGQEAPPEEAGRLLSAAYVLTGLRVPQETAARLFEGIHSMRESSTYQAILEEGRTEGRAEEARRILLRLARARLGEPGTAVETSLQGITDPERLERMIDRCHETSSWQDLLQTP
ncbi:MAG: hypothetical protein L0Z62_43000 [Gemmataceae bacterium]|nr:hypothetical protein [Gemmataceae bacterium]